MFWLVTNRNIQAMASGATSPTSLFGQLLKMPIRPPKLPGPNLHGGSSDKRLSRLLTNFLTLADVAGRSEARHISGSWLQQYLASIDGSRIHCYGLVRALLQGIDRSVLIARGLIPPALVKQQTVGV